MNRPSVAKLALVAVVALALPHLLFAAGPKRGQATCYVLVEEGASSEGNSLFLNKMGLDAAALGLVSPTRFSFGTKSSLTRASASFSYESDQPVLVERSGRLALYSVAITYKAEGYPLFFKTVVVEMKFADLRSTKDLVQPGAKAIELAAAKAGMKAGLAWILKMELVDHSRIRATVGLAK